MANKVPNTNITYYGDNVKTFYARVINVNDPLQLGRVQIRVVGIHSESEDDIPTADLPWAMVLVPTTEGGVSGIGATNGLKPFSLVFGYFVDGDNAQEPLVFGSIPNYQRDPILSVSILDINPHDFRAVIKSVENPDDLLPGNTNIEKTWNWFKSDNGGRYSAEVIAGMIGNFWIESFAIKNNNDIDPKAVQGDGGPGRGIAQWDNRHERFTELVERSAGFGLSHETLLAQLMHVTRELNTRKIMAKGRLIESRTPEEASDIFMALYEVPPTPNVIEKVDGVKTRFGIPFPRPKSLGGIEYDFYMLSFPRAQVKERRKISRDIYNNFTS